MKTIIECLNDKNLLPDGVSDAQRVALKAVYGLRMTRQERRLFKECTGHDYKRKQYHECAFVIGRRGGKSSKLAATVACYEATMGGHEKYLSKGETGTVLILAQSMKLSQVVFKYILGRLEASPLLSGMIVDVKKEEIILRNGITISCFPSNYKSIRGLSIPVAICDEVSFWQFEGTANPDTEVINSIKPAQRMFPDRKLILISTPFTARGYFWDLWNRRHDPDMRDVLIFHAPSWVANPTLTEEELRKEREKDELTFRREYGAEFIDLQDAFLPDEVIGGCVVRGRRELPPIEKFKYHAAIDEAWKGDRFTFAVAHKEERRVVFDVLHGWKGGGAEQVFDEIARWCKKYNIRMVFADQYSSEPTKLALRQREVFISPIPFTAQSKPSIYSKLKAALAVDDVELLDHKDSLAELRALQVKVAPSGQPKISASHDDYADVMAILVSKLSGNVGPAVPKYDDSKTESPRASERAVSAILGRHLGERVRPDMKF